GYRTYVALTYISFNIVGFVVNLWVLYVVAPLLFAPAVKVPKSILFFIFALVVGDLTTMIGESMRCLWWGTNALLSFPGSNALTTTPCGSFVSPVSQLVLSIFCRQQSPNSGTGETKDPHVFQFAALQVLIALACVMVLLWPVFAYSQVFTFYLNPNNITNEVTVIRKCGFLPPPEIQFWFNLVACITSYAVPLFGIVYWYVSVPFFLKNRAITTLVASSSTDTALRKVITTVLLLTAIYVLCWSPYWVSMFAHNIFAMEKKSTIVVSYFIHLLPYVSCVAYPLIFTLLNRGIRLAHAKIVLNQRRRFRSITDDASFQIRNAVR
ncbi:hypothetical protein Angca_004203, partial [Angiostrongylus cantonensis]